MENIAKDILNYLGNEHTKVELKEDFKGNYYSYIIDTIYIAKNFKEQKVPAKAKNINKKAAELVVICHECIHSMQNKCMHILNTIFSNLAIILSVMYIVLGLFWTNSAWNKTITSIVILISIIIRLILEIGAINGSVKLALDIVSKGMAEDVSKEDIEAGAKYMNNHKCLALLQMVLDKIIFLILVLVI